MSSIKEFQHLRISLQDVISATNNFAETNCIGRGGFGKVYKGEILLSGVLTMAAIKRLDRSFGQGITEFWKEIMMLSQYKHENIVSLLGFCDEGTEKLLVFEYLSNKSLDLYLNSNDLSWNQRLIICLGAAKGLEYLHEPVEGSQQRVLHRDIKSANILLDHNWRPKIADFGLSKLGPANQQFTFLISNAVGTMGYCDPLYAHTSFLTKESDVYSFGVVLFEVLCGRPCVQNYDDIRRSLTALSRKCYEEKKMDTIIHIGLQNNISPICLERFSSIAYQCLQLDRAERPTMGKVVQELRDALWYQSKHSLLAKIWEESHELGSQSDDSFHIEPMYDAFLCPLTKQIMRDPVTTENGQTFEREAIEKWFSECKENGRKLVCPLTLKELKTTDMNPSYALRNTIKEWNARNEVVLLDIVRKSFNVGCPETENLRALRFVRQLCQKNYSNKHIIRNAKLIPLIVDMLKSSSHRVRCLALESLRIVVEDDDDNKKIMAEGDYVRTIVKFLAHEQSKEREEAVSLLYELSKLETLCEKIGSVNGATLILVGMTSSKSENLLTVEKADKTLENLENNENHVRQMAENGRLQPLLRLLLEGSPETKLSMASCLGELALSNDVKVFVARTVGLSLINLMKSGNIQSKEAALKALNQVSSSDPSAKILVEEGILSPLVKDLFAWQNQLPMRLEEISATILANIVTSDCDFDLIPVGPNHQTLVSEDIIHNLLHLISNTGPAIACKLLQVLVGLTSSPATLIGVVSAIRSSGAINSLVQFIEDPQQDLRLASIKLLQNLSPNMGQELSSSLRGSVGQLGGFTKVIVENIATTEEQAAAVGLLAELPERDMGLTRQMLDEGVFEMVISRIRMFQQGRPRRTRFVTPYLDGLVRILSRITFVLQEEPKAVALCQQYDLAGVFTELLQSNSLDNVQMVSAFALEKLSLESNNITKLPEIPRPSFRGSIFPFLRKQPVMTGLCRVHRGECSRRDTFCLLEGPVLQRLVSLLDHTNEKVVEACLAALSTILDDDVNIEGGVAVLIEVEGIKPILDVLVEKKTENLWRRAVWVVERLLRTEDIAQEVAPDANVTTALVNAFQHGDYRTRQIAELALKHVDRIPNFSGIFPK